MSLFNEDDINYFIKNIWTNDFINNTGGMGSPDLFSLWIILKKYKPKIVIESGVWNGISTKLIRKVLPNSVIICLDPRNIPNNGYKDDNKNTIYYLGNKFIDFKNLNLNKFNKNDILCFFDCHQNQYLRLKQCIEKKITKIFFNDNYPLNCGSHFTIEHLMNNDNRYYKIDNNNKNKILDLIETYHIFPNIYPGLIKTGEGYFKCKSYFTNDNDNNNDKFIILKKERNKYRWNTFIILKL
tara:strand:+ start:497 stop:1216 length:720 start_codon:yes stop_codon:yes gene_type:complete